MGGTPLPDFLLRKKVRRNSLMAQQNVVAWKMSGLHDPQAFDPNQGSVWTIGALPNPEKVDENYFLLSRWWGMETCFVPPENMPRYFVLVN